MSLPPGADLAVLAKINYVSGHTAASSLVILGLVSNVHLDHNEHDGVASPDLE